MTNFMPDPIPDTSLVLADLLNQAMSRMDSVRSCLIHEGPWGALDTQDLRAKVAEQKRLQDKVNGFAEKNDAELLDSIRQGFAEMWAERKAMTYDRNGPPSSNMMQAWYSLKGKGMASAVGEYTPDEFWYLLDVVEGQELKMQKMREWMERCVSSDAGSPDYLCPAGRVQVGLPAFKAKA